MGSTIVCHAKNDQPSLGKRPFPRFVFFLEVILKFIDKTPEETRDEKYAEDFKDLKKRVIDALKKKDPDYAPWCN